MMDPKTRLWTNANLATMAGSAPYGRMPDSAMAVSEGKIIWIGAGAAIPKAIDQQVHDVVDVQGRWITPGLIDCHTHMVFAGSRSKEFEMRLQGISYEQIAKQGGGIRSTVTATRQATTEDLFQQSARRLKSLLKEGVTVVEIKSGYGLDLDTEMRMLEVARKLAHAFPVDVMPTFLGAHALAPEYENQPDAYIDHICEAMMPAIAQNHLAHAVDAYCETIGFTRDQCHRLFRSARAHGLKIKVHAGQFSDQGVVELAARFGALSADHLEYVSAEGVKAMAEAGMVAVLLPGAFYFLRESQMPPIDLFRKFDVKMAVATDCNPGSSPVGSILLMLNMACTLFRLTPEEALAGITCHAAQALGLGHKKGTLQPGKDADFVVWDIDDPSELAYAMGFNPCHQVIKAGTPVSETS